jgi:1,4-alpha-glucan branching enzyme
MDACCEKGAGERHSACHSLRPNHFYCRAPGAQSVEIAGDFNDWQPAPMSRRPDGCWYIQEMLCHGHHRYRFLVDGQPMLDPAATGVGRGENGEPVSLIAVS